MKYGKTDVVICEDAADLGEKSAAALPASILLEYEGTLFVDRDSCPSEFGGRPG